MVRDKRITIDLDKKEYRQLKSLKEENGYTWRGMLKHGWRPGVYFDETGELGTPTGSDEYD